MKTVVGVLQAVVDTTGSSLTELSIGLARS